MAQSVPQKLGIKSGMSVIAIGQPVAAVVTIVGQLPEGSTLAASADAADVVLLFSDALGDVRWQAPAAWSLAAPSGRLWIAYRKGVSKRGAGGEVPLHRDTLQAALAEIGLTGVTLVALDGVWSALRVKQLG